MNDQRRLELTYALAKQLPTAYAVDGPYGSFAIDDEMRAAVEKTLRPLIEKKLKGGSEQ